MQDFLQLVVDNFELILSVVIGFLCFLLAWFRTGSVKKAIKQLKEYEDMIKFRKASKAMEEKRVGQKFSNTVTDYILDPATNELQESPIPKDVQAKIESYIDVALDRALERFLPKNVQDVDGVMDYTQHSQDLSVMGEAFEVAEEYRERYNLDSNMSVADIYKFVEEQADKMKNDLLKYNQPKQEEVKQDVESKTKETK